MSISQHRENTSRAFQNSYLSSVFGQEMLFVQVFQALQVSRFIVADLAKTSAIGAPVHPLAIFW